VLAPGLSTITGAYAAYCFHQNVSDVAIYAGGSFMRAISGEAVGAFGVFGFFGVVGVVFCGLFSHVFCVTDDAQLFVFFLSPIFIISVLTRYSPSHSVHHSLSIVHFERSIILPCLSKSPVSSTITSSLFFVFRLVTLSTVPNGYTLCAQ